MLDGLFKIYAHQLLVAQKLSFIVIASKDAELVILLSLTLQLTIFVSAQKDLLLCSQSATLSLAALLPMVVHFALFVTLVSTFSSLPLLKDSVFVALILN